MVRSSGVCSCTNIFLASSFYHHHDRQHLWSDLSRSLLGPGDATASGVILQPYEDQACPLGLGMYSHPSWQWQQCTATTYISHNVTACSTTATPIFPLCISLLLKCRPCSCHAILSWHKRSLTYSNTLYPTYIAIYTHWIFHFYWSSHVWLPLQQLSGEEKHKQNKED
jgi:hypothetical protein